MPYNQQQQLAIAHRGSPLMIQAGAGTGKTTTIIGRVVSLLEEGVPPENICMMTFTNKAANSMLTKIVAKTPQGRRITVGTFHGIALQLLYKTAALTGMPMNYKVFGGYETEKLWRRAIANSVGEEDFKILSAGKLQKPGIYDDEQVLDSKRVKVESHDGLSRNVLDFRKCIHAVPQSPRFVKFDCYTFLHVLPLIRPFQR